MTRSEITRELLLTFCYSLPEFPWCVDRINDLSESDWENFENYVENQARYSWYTASSIMDAVDSLVDSGIKQGKLTLDRT